MHLTRLRVPHSALAIAGAAVALSVTVSGCGSSSGDPATASVPDSPATSAPASPSASTSASTSASSGQSGQSAATVDGVKVEGALGEQPTITIDGGVKPPSELVVKELSPGTGPAVQPGDVVTGHYVGVAWGTGQVFDSSWAGEPATFALDQLIPGWQEGLVGQKAGSRTLLIIPPELGYGAQEIPGIPANSTLVFVADLIAVNGQS